MRKIAIASAFLTVFPTSLSAQPLDAWLDELRHGFTLDGKPVPPKIFADFGDDDLSGPEKSVSVTVDLIAAIGNRLYADPIVRAQGGWLWQRKASSGIENSGERIGYEFMGTTDNELLIVVASYSGGGSGAYCTLHILDAAASHGLYSDGKAYDRLNLTVLRNVPLGDRWKGSVRITGNTVAVLTSPGFPNNPNLEEETLTIEVERP
jgi:hypothetical protein